MSDIETGASPHANPDPENDATSDNPGNTVEQGRLSRQVDSFIAKVYLATNFVLPGGFNPNLPSASEEPAAPEEPTGSEEGGFTGIVGEGENVDSGLGAADITVEPVLDDGRGYGDYITRDTLVSPNDMEGNPIYVRSEDSPPEFNPNFVLQGQQLEFGRVDLSEKLGDIQHVSLVGAVDTDESRTAFEDSIKAMEEAYKVSYTLTRNAKKATEAALAVEGAGVLKLALITNQLTRELAAKILAQRKEQDLKHTVPARELVAMLADSEERRDVEIDTRLRRRIPMIHDNYSSILRPGYLERFLLDDLDSSETIDVDVDEDGRAQLMFVIPSRTIDSTLIFGKRLTYPDRYRIAFSQPIRIENNYDKFHNPDIDSDTKSGRSYLPSVSSESQGPTPMITPDGLHEHIKPRTSKNNFSMKPFDFEEDYKNFINPPNFGRKGGDETLINLNELDYSAVQSVGLDHPAVQAFLAKQAAAGQSLDDPESWDYRIVNGKVVALKPVDEGNKSDTSWDIPVDPSVGGLMDDEDQ